MGSDFKFYGGASLTEGPSDNYTSGVANIRSGSPGEIGSIRIRTGIVGDDGHRLDNFSLSFRYLAGYTPKKNQTRLAATVTVLFLDAETLDVLHALPSTAPLGDYSWDHFSGYSPRVAINATGLDLPNGRPVLVELQV